jgi:hypothetical protein
MMVNVMTPVITMVSVTLHNRMSEAIVIEFWYFQCKGKNVCSLYSLLG